MFKILQGRLQQYVIQELPDVKAGFRKGRGIKYQIANMRWTIEKAREFQKTIYFSLLTRPKPLTGSITTNWKILQEMENNDELCHYLFIHLIIHSMKTY